MKTKIFLFMSLVMGLILASCNDDDDYAISNTPILNENSVVTGSADVTANSVTFHGSVDGLDKSSAASYSVGFNYGTSATDLKESVGGALADGVITATVSGLTDGLTVYYQAYVTLQGKVTYTGEVKSCVTTDAEVLTNDAAQISAVGAKLAGSVTGAPADAVRGIVIAAAPQARSRAEISEDVRAGLVVPATVTTDAFAVEMKGLAPATTYQYASYVDLGSGIVYGPVKTFTTAAAGFDIENDLVDLGLSVKWAKYNVGATTENEIGGYFNFGDLTGVNNSIDPADYASDDIYKTDRDIANKAWNGSVTLPTQADFEELFSSCTQEWTEVEGVAGYKLTGPNGNSIFLPAAGSRTINTVSGAGVSGAYATGSVNTGNSQYAVAYTFSQGSTQRTSTPVYQALSVRPVSTAHNVPFVKENLYNTWEIDFNKGKSLLFAGPVFFYGTDDCWRTVSNGEPIIGDSWSWEADASNSWAFGGAEGTVGSMTLDAEGNIKVTYSDGTSKEGKYTIDEVNKTITADIPLLTPANFPDQCANLRNEIRILSLSADKFQTAFYRDGDPALLSVNMIPKSKKYDYPVQLSCVDSNWGGNWGAEIGALSPDNLNGTHTFTYNGSTSNVMVFTIDIPGLAAAYPNAIVYPKAIRLDGKEIKFDVNNMRFGDIENNGTYRVELFNIYGKNAAGGKVLKSAFSAATNVDNDAAVAFTSKIEFDLVVDTDPVSYTPQLVTINPDWGGSWDFNQGATFTPVVNADNMIVPSRTEFDITLKSTDTGVDYTAGSIMTFVNVNGLMDIFPGTYSTLDALVLDGKAVTGWDAAKVYNSNDGSSYRLELWNEYGVSASKGCAFGTPVALGDNKVIAELGFSDSMQVKFTINGFFTPVEW